MSGDNIQSREAQLTPEDDKKLLNSFFKMPLDKFALAAHEIWTDLENASEDTKQKFLAKCDKCGVSITPHSQGPDPFQPGAMAKPAQPEKIDSHKPKQKAPAIIEKRLKSDPNPPQESNDIEYLSVEEISIGEEISTLKTRLVEDPDAGDNHIGPWIERCVGRNQDSGKLQVVRVPAKEIEVLPTQVIHYRGSVVMDLNSVHSGNIVIGHRRFGYVFDRFFYHNGRKYPRCCLVDNRVHQAGLLYEKAVDRRTRKAFARIKRILKSTEPMYEVIGAKETDYRDLKRLFERYFLNRHDRVEEDDPALQQLLGKIPLVSQGEFGG